jgi:thiol-disulfide isomerase/thioredoxin
MGKTKMVLKDKLTERLSKFGFLFAIIGILPIRSGILLFQGKECGCFLIDKATLHAHNVLFGAVSIVVGLGLVILGILSHVEVSSKTAKVWISVFLLASGIAGYSLGTAKEIQQPKEIAGTYDELTQKLTENGWVFFYTTWCPRCHEEIEMLGASVKNLRMIDCDTITCPEFVQGYPTWARIINGNVIEVKDGFQSIETLEEMAK